MNLELFKNNGYEIRGFMIDDEPYFVGKDIAECLGYEKVSNAIARHVDTEDKMQFESCLISGQVRDKHKCIVSDFKNEAVLASIDNRSILIKEAGLYSLIMRSKLNKTEEKKGIPFSILKECEIEVQGFKHLYLSEREFNLVVSGYDEQNFAVWCKKNLVEDFEEGTDYIKKFLEKLNASDVGRQKIDYLITLDTGKELAMMSRKPKLRGEQYE